MIIQITAGLSVSWSCQPFLSPYLKRILARQIVDFHFLHNRVEN
jgi:hypothetical protein